MSAEVLYTDRFKQPLLFEGMAFNKIYPTDIDAITEYHNRLFIIMEVKGDSVPISYGQITALTRMIDALEETHKDAFLFICRHQVNDPSEPIYLKDTIVTDFYYKKEWRKASGLTAGQVWLNVMQWAYEKERRM